MKKVCLIFLALALLAVFGLRAYFAFVPPPEASLGQSLADILPNKMPGWEITDHDMAKSPEASARVSNFLNFDDAIFRSYRRGDTLIGVYVAYWKPGKASYRWAGSHTPDTCWIINGWTRCDRKYSIPFKTKNQEFEPAEFGVYEKNGTTQKVYFWHLVGGKANAYKQKKHSYYLNALKDIQKHGLNQRKEQFFVRLSSNKDIEILSQLKGFNDITDAMLDLNMQKKTS